MPAGEAWKGVAEAGAAHPFGNAGRDQADAAPADGARTGGAAGARPPRTGFRVQRSSNSSW